MSAAESRATSVVFCADDYGLTEGVSEGIADLTAAVTVTSGGQSIKFGRR